MSRQASESHQLRRDPPPLHPQDEHRMSGSAAPLGRRAGVQHPEMLEPLHLRDVGMAVDDRLAVLEAGPRAAPPAAPAAPRREPSRSAPCRPPRRAASAAQPSGPARPCSRGLLRRADRKSTRLNSSHVKISYAVFCLKKKKKKKNHHRLIKKKQKKLN